MTYCPVLTNFEGKTPCDVIVLFVVCRMYGFLAQIVETQWHQAGQIERPVGLDAVQRQNCPEARCLEGCSCSAEGPETGDFLATSAGFGKVEEESNSSQQAGAGADGISRVLLVTFSSIPRVGFFERVWLFVTRCYGHYIDVPLWLMSGRRSTSWC